MKTKLLRNLILALLILNCWSEFKSSHKVACAQHLKTKPAEDWPMFGGSSDRNMFHLAKNVSFEFDFPKMAKGKIKRPGKKLLWTNRLGSQTYGSIAVSGGKVFVGTNNQGKYRPGITGDKGVVLCFDEETGKFLWQLTRDKLRSGRVNDWPLQGIVSTPCVEKDRMWIVTNRAELMCLDTNGFYDDENDGPVTDESRAEQKDADIVWSLDMIKSPFNVFPHNLAISSPVVYEDYIYINTSNGVDEAHLNLPNPDAPSFLAVHKETGKVIWQDNSPGENVLHGQWSSPSIGVVNGQSQVYMAGGDGWLYAFETLTGKLIWKFDLNPKATKWELGGAGTRNSVISTPVFYKNTVIIATGQDPEHGEGPAFLYRIDATKIGDVSAEVGDVGIAGFPNPNSAMIWRYGGIDKDGSVTGEKGDTIFNRTLSTASVADGKVFIPDISGYLHCIDLENGKRLWRYDMLSAAWGSALFVDGKVMLGNEDGEFLIFNPDNGKPLAKKEASNYSSIYGTPAIANRKMFVVARSRLFVFSIEE